MSDKLYDRDILDWSATQATRLRRLAAGETVNNVDWAHVIEEIEDVGKSELQAVQSLLLQALAHSIKLGTMPQYYPAQHWRYEALLFVSQARRRFQPGMWQHIHLEKIWRDAVEIVTASYAPTTAIPNECPLTLNEVMDQDWPPTKVLTLLVIGSTDDT